MTVKQLSIFAENRPGRLSAITKLLADNGINIRAMSVADTKDFGILRLIVNDADKAVAALKAGGCAVTVANVLAIQIPDVPGGLAAAMQVLYDNNVSVEYMYSAFVSEKSAEAYLILRADSNEKAEEAFDGKYKLLSQEELLNK
ncbi:MAG: ACT domain-containing protein [Ruminococcus sp.]|nr:ACT domain-containing protein [Ruminococcus sp.]